MNAGPPMPAFLFLEKRPSSPAGMYRNKTNPPLIVHIVLLMLVSCAKEQNAITEPIQTIIAVPIITDKAAYSPNEPVSFSIDKDIPANSKIRYWHLDQVLQEVSYSGKNWTWQAPATDHRGYMVDIYNIENGIETVYGSIGVDISSDWTRFPRYGFLSKFSSTEDIEGVISNLNRYHINGVQFYDWHHKHHKPLAGIPSNPDSVWQDIANRNIFLSTVRGYIAAAHNRNMKAMFYNLAYGATNTAGSDGVADQWFLFKDNLHTTRDFHDLPEPPFNSDLYVTNSGNPAWQQYLINRNNDVYAAFDFDGFHIDQLGDRGTVYDYNGTSVNLANTFNPFIQAMKTDSPSKNLVFNAVNQYGQTDIAQSPVDFLYSEVWSPNESYSDLARIITDNDSYSGNTRKTVLAAYVNYNLANRPGAFNTPGVLLTDAVIFAFGGSHLELGEHMLGKEYFPNSNLQMSDELKKKLIDYYDFLVAYQNLLRDGGIFNSPTVTATDGIYPFDYWPPQAGKVSVAGKSVGGKQVIHLLNFLNAATLDWRDTNGNKTVPTTIQNVKLTYATPQKITKVWIASPDISHGSPEQLSFQQSGNAVTFTIPSLTYWDMIVIE